MHQTRKVKDKMHCPEIVTDIHVAHGSVSTDIINLIEELNSDLLVVGACGHSGVARFFLGNVTEKLLRKVPCSMMIVKNDQEVNI